MKNGVDFWFFLEIYDWKVGCVSRFGDFHRCEVVDTQIDCHGWEVVGTF
jgi:hypothetical protein